MNSVNPSEPKTMIHLEHPTTDEIVEIYPGVEVRPGPSLRERFTTMAPHDDDTYMGQSVDDVVDGQVEIVAQWLEEQWPVIYAYGPTPKLIAAALAVVARR